MLPQRGEAGKVILCVDMDYFYAQCEQLRNSALASVPVVICVFSSRGKDSGAVSTANYIARRYGVKSGMPIVRAKSLLKGVSEAVFLPADFDYYELISARVMELLRAEADAFEQVSVDEAFLDVTRRAEGSLDRGLAQAASLKSALRSNLGLTCTVGVGPTKLLSKMAANLAKPDGLLKLAYDDVPEKLWPLPVEELYGIGKKTAARLRELGLSTIGDLARADVNLLKQAFGKALGTYLYLAANGTYEEPLRTVPKVESISRIITLREDATSAGQVERELEQLCRQVHARVVREGWTFRTVGLIFVMEDLSIRTKSRSLETSTDSLEVLLQEAKQLCGEFFNEARMPVRRLGVKVASLSKAEGQARLTQFMSGN